MPINEKRRPSPSVNILSKSSVLITSSWYERLKENDNINDDNSDDNNNNNNNNNNIDNDKNNNDNEKRGI